MYAVIVGDVFYREAVWIAFHFRKDPQESDKGSGGEKPTMHTIVLLLHLSIAMCLIWQHAVVCLNLC